MATLIGSYTYDWGRAIPVHDTAANTVKATMWTFVHQLLGNLGGLTQGIWTCMGSGNGSTGGMDGVNRWWNSGTFDPALMPYSSGTGQPQGWMVIKSPDTIGPIYLLFAAGNGAQWFGGGSLDLRQYYVWGSYTPYTGGSATVLPSSTAGYSFSYFDPNSGGIQRGWRVIWDTNDHSPRNCHLSLASDGGFFWSCSVTGTRLVSGFIVNPLQDAASGDAHPVVVGLLQDLAGATSAAHFTSSRSNAMLSAYAAAYLNQDKVTSRYGHRFYGISNALYQSYAILVPVIMGQEAYQGVGGDVFGYGGYGTAPHFDYVRQQYPEWPIYLVLGNGTVSTQNTVKGRLRDMYFSFGLPEGTVEPNGTGPITRVVWGDCWVPANQVWAY